METFLSVYVIIPEIQDLPLDEGRVTNIDGNLVRIIARNCSRGFYGCDAVYRHCMDNQFPITERFVQTHRVSTSI